MLTAERRPLPTRALIAGALTVEGRCGGGLTWELDSQSPPSWEGGQEPAKARAHLSAQECPLRTERFCLRRAWARLLACLGGHVQAGVCLGLSSLGPESCGHQRGHSPAGGLVPRDQVLLSPPISFPTSLSWPRGSEWSASVCAHTHTLTHIHPINHTYTPTLYTTPTHTDTP